MQLIRTVTFSLFVAFAISSSPRSHPFRRALNSRQASTNDALTVDLGYGVYLGSTNATTGIDTWRGIRFAAAPIGQLRWQRPKPPNTNRSTITQADRYGPMCNQVGFGGGPNFGGSGSTADISEDCLFLNIQGPSNATNLPVLVWIHGGGYGAGNGRQDFTDLLRTNGNNFLVVSTQYRLGPFGFLASDEVARKGVANAGLLDQFFALQWVQTYINQFGRDPSSVTISGESVGGGSVMLQDMAYGGSLGESLFRGTIAASPYLPKQYAYNDWVPTQVYYAFADRAGCPLSVYNHANATIFACLVSKDTAALQNASAEVSATDEGPLFTTQDITSESKFFEWLRDILPDFGNDDIDKILLYYPSGNGKNNSTGVNFATSGYSGPSALNQSSLATGQQQRANGRTSYRYQFSALPGTHGSDLQAYFGPLGGSSDLGIDYQRAFMSKLGNHMRPALPTLTVPRNMGQLSGVPFNQTAQPNPASTWPAFSATSPYQLDLNQTGGTAAVGGIDVVSPVKTTHFTGPGLRNNLTIANAYTWEAGRGMRCDFWRIVAAIIPA
ncbi:alpha/beta-hydrolase [Ophiobolus disseminans]|uniref:Alpha/beta-hydrolase n=1 Tax=Ophiobolus disseminans TaxID=1469910 RepID=A0A6A6ZWU5_9PLEO|nr:alpha/beta-hydrolase [Ophiobolus disseminans]